MQNGAYWCGGLGKKERLLLPLGTTSNESMRRELNSWCIRVTGQHRERLRLISKVFGLSKLLAHNCARFAPTTMQMDQSEILNNITARLSLGFFQDIAASASDRAICISDLKKPLIPQDTGRATRRKAEKDAKAKRTSREKEIRAKKRPRRAAVVTKKKKKKEMSPRRRGLDGGRK